MLTDEKIRKYQKLWFTEFGEKISFNEAKEKAAQLVEFYKVIFQPIPDNFEKLNKNH